MSRAVEGLRDEGKRGRRRREEVNFLRRSGKVELKAKITIFYDKFESRRD
jgi:hypothetical protein